MSINIKSLMAQLQPFTGTSMSAQIKPSMGQKGDVYVIYSYTTVLAIVKPTDKQVIIDPSFFSHTTSVQRQNVKYLYTQLGYEIIDHVFSLASQAHFAL